MSKTRRSYLFIGVNAGGAAEIKLGFFDCECLTGTRVAVTVESAAFAAVHGQLTLLTPLYKAGITAEFEKFSLMGNLVLDHLQKKAKK